MRVRLTDGTRTLDIRAKGVTLDQLEATTLRLLAALPPPPEQTHPTPTPFGYTADLDRIALDSSAERAEPAVDTLLPDEDDQAQHEPTSTHTDGDTHA
ncbi:hypothetical protein OIE71_04695 [Streptomyces sp. NBC_01725]|uniref:hypothetical protein n=1 Tax=Streptomyces sp. NBC_01725 TaxID=2975923 RepID=UPI002E288E8E|nr:hypothetical protein [Streptomyces sp. NBC_01725]